MSKSDQELISEDEALQVGVSALFNAGASQVNGATPLQGLLAVTVPVLAFLAAKGGQHLLNRRSGLLVQGYARAFGDDPKRINDHAEQHRDDVTYQETMFRTFRAMADAAEPEVIETLGYMAGVYTAAGMRPNALFRGLGRVLCDLEEGELQQFRDLLLAVESIRATFKISEPAIHLTFGREDEPQDNNVRALVPGNEQPVTIGGVSHGARLFSLLKRELFARSPSTGMPGAYLFDDSERSAPPEGERAAVVAFETVDMLLRFVEPGRHAT